MAKATEQELRDMLQELMDANTRAAGEDLAGIERRAHEKATKLLQAA